MARARRTLSALTVSCLLCTIISTTLASSLTSTLEVNFQAPSTDKCSEDVTADVGNPFGSRTTELNFGWVSKETGEPINATQNTRDGLGAVDDSCVLRTYTHMQYADCCSDRPEEGVLDELAWKIELPNGEYQVEVVCGDPSDTGSVHGIVANGVQVIAPQAPTGLTPEVSGFAFISVTTGSITFAPAAGSQNTKLSLIRIVRPTVAAFDGSSGCIPFPSKFDGKSISVLSCEEVTVEQFELKFDGSQPGMLDRNGVPTGFTMFLPNSGASLAYDPNKIVVHQDRVTFTSARGRMNKENNDAINALGWGLAVPDKDFRVTATFRVPTDLKGVWERCCLFFAISDHDNLRVCYVSTKRGDRMFAHYESTDEKKTRVYEWTALDSSREITLILELFSLNDYVRVKYLPGNVGEPRGLLNITTASDMFSKDAAGSDYNLGTRTFTGVLVNSPWRKTDVDFDLLRFSIEEIPRSTGVGGKSEVDFDTWYVRNVAFPTAIASGPDGKLYIARVDGHIVVVEMDDQAGREISRRVYLPLGERLLLGITVDPESTADNLVLWACHSDPSQNNGLANSGVVSKISGADLSVVEDVIIGLPRAVANHAPNQLLFGPDGRLYITVGGNTAGGTPNNVNGTDFGFRPEQCLSAAMLVADVRKADFNGDCTPAQDSAEMDLTGIAEECGVNTCDVYVYATGLRNPFDFKFYNGHLYLTDNGLGGKGTAPKRPDGYQPGDSCHGPVLDDDIQSLDPGRRDDLLIDVKEGAYYGHPNPARRECVYYGGNPSRDADFVVDRLPLAEGGTYTMDFGKYRHKTMPDPKYTMPMFSLGRSHSANGIIVYDSMAFCGELKGDILTTFYSLNDQVRRIELNEAGDKVVADSTLPRTTTSTGAEVRLKNPLAIEQDSLGNIYIAEFFGSQVRVLTPVAQQCSTRLVTASKSTEGPSGLEFVSSVTANRRIYAFGGRSLKDGSISQEVHQFDTYQKSWSTVGSSPRALYGSAAVKIDGQKALIIGGYDIEGRPSSSLLIFDLKEHTFIQSAVDMPASRGGASAVLAPSQDKVWVLGGVDHTGRPTASVLELHLPTMTWTESDRRMHVERTGAVAVTMANRVMVCGGSGHERQELNHCEMFNGEHWMAVSPMPTARFHASAIVVDGKLLVKGGERALGDISNAVEEFDPVSGTWTELQPMKTARTAFSSVRIGSGIYTVAGRTAHEDNASEVIFYK